MMLLFLLLLYHFLQLIRQGLPRQGATVDALRRIGRLHKPQGARSARRVTTTTTTYWLRRRRHLTKADRERAPEQERERETERLLKSPVTCKKSIDCTMRRQVRQLSHKVCRARGGEGRRGL